MIRSIRPVVALLGVPTIGGILATCVWWANEWIASTLATVTVLTWLNLWLVAVYCRERVRALAVGALVAGGVYWLLALGPWFNVHVGQTLLTSRLLAWLSAPQVQAGQQPPVYTYNTSYMPVSFTTGLPVQSGDLVLTSSGIVTTSPQIAWGVSNPPIVTIPSPAYRQIAGQWAFTWLFALCGGSFAWLLCVRNARRQSKELLPVQAPAEERP